jgi:hypothetical protein
MFLLPRVSFSCRRFRCSHETAIELKVLLANEKLMFHSYLLRAWTGSHIAPKRGRSRTYYLPERSSYLPERSRKTTTSLGKPSPTLLQSWLDPLIIISALPGALAGIVWMLFVTETTLSVPALTGALMVRSPVHGQSQSHLHLAGRRVRWHGSHPSGRRYRLGSRELSLGRPGHPEVLTFSPKLDARKAGWKSRPFLLSARCPRNPTDEL